MVASPEDSAVGEEEEDVESGIIQPKRQRYWSLGIVKWLSCLQFVLYGINIWFGSYWSAIIGIIGAVSGIVACLQQKNQLLVLNFSIGCNLVCLVAQLVALVLLISSKMLADEKLASDGSNSNIENFQSVHWITVCALVSCVSCLFVVLALIFYTIKLRKELVDKHSSFSCEQDVHYIQEYSEIQTSKSVQETQQDGVA